MVRTMECLLYTHRTCNTDANNINILPENTFEVG